MFEITARIFLKENFFGYPDGLHIPDDTKGYRYNPSFIGKFPNQLYEDIEIRINSKGLRDYEHEYEKSAGKTRILALGDSVTFGSGVEYEDTYLRQLERKMQDNGFNVEIIKTGVNGYEFDQQYTYYFEEGHKYGPDIVLIGVVLNDVRKVNPQDVKASYQNEQRLIPKIRKAIGRHLKSVKFTYESIMNIIGPKREDYNAEYFRRLSATWKGESGKRYERKVLDLNEHLKKDGIKLMLVIFPYTQYFTHSINAERDPQKRILDLASKNNFTAIDLTPHLDLPDYMDYYLPSDTVHLNAAGYARVKDVIYSALLTEGIIIQ